MRVEYIDHMGSDIDVVNAARVSLAAESQLDDEGRLLERDEKLIGYLARHHHWTPAAHTAIKLRMTAPIPIRTQCFKHKQGFVENEESRRYIATKPDLFVPDVFRWKPQGSVKQGSAGPHPRSSYWQGRYILQCREAIVLYEDMVADGVCAEQARFVLPQGVEVRWIWTGNLASYARFYGQRTDSHAQQEIQDLARMVGAVIAPLFPVTWAALTGAN